MAVIVTPACSSSNGYIVPNMPSVAFSVVKSDADEFDDGIHLYVGTGGDVRVIAQSHTEVVVYKNFPSGLVLPVKIKKLFSTGTTANDFVGSK